MNDPLLKLLTAGLLLGAVSAQGIVLVQYQFTGTPADKSASVVDSGITASDVNLESLTEDTSRSGHLGLTNTHEIPSFILFHLDAGAATFNFEDSDPAEGLISFDLEEFNGGTGAGRFVETWVSTDYNPAVGTISENEAAASWTSLGQTLITDTAVASHSLTGLGFSGTAIVAFKIDVKTTANWHDSGIDNLTVTGAVPEPSTYALLFGSLALGGVMLRRRFKG